MSLLPVSQFQWQLESFLVSAGCHGAFGLLALVGGNRTMQLSLAISITQAVFKESFSSALWYSLAVCNVSHRSEHCGMLEVSTSPLALHTAYRHKQKHFKTLSVAVLSCYFWSTLAIFTAKVRQILHLSKTLISFVLILFFH